MSNQPPDPADQPLDDLDDLILGQLRSAWDLVDPPPARLDGLVRFAIRLENADIELSRLLEDAAADSVIREAGAPQAITLESESLTVMLAVHDLDLGRCRVEGWLAPPAAAVLELRVAEDLSAPEGVVAETPAESTGRFVFADVGRGPAQLTVRREAGDGAPPGIVVTVPFRLGGPSAGSQPER